MYIANSDRLTLPSIAVQQRRLFVRAGVIIGVILGHIALLLLLMLTPKDAIPAGPAGFNGSLILADLIAASPAEAAAPVPRKPLTSKPARRVATPRAEPAAEVADEAIDMPSVDPAPPSPDSGALVLSTADADALSKFQPSSNTGQPDTPCDLTSTVVHDFASSPVVRQGVEELPVSEKSVANAVQMWDGAWPVETQSGGKALLRALLTREISASRPDCLQQVNQGPVFVFVPDGDATVVVAIGSGTWQWGQLVE